MRQPAFRKKTKGRPTSGTATDPAPILGWNAKDALSEMEAGYAVDTDNWFGETTDVRVRKGWTNHVTGIVEQVESLMPYNAAGGTQTLFGAADDSFYNFTSAGSVGAAVVGSLSNARWQHVNFTNTAGTSYLCCFNGVDAPQYWNGSAWIAITGVSTPAITGITATSIVNATVFKRRIYLILNNSLVLYYLPIDSVGGAAKRASLEGYFSLGGSIVAAHTWSLDAGDGLDDHLVVVSSEGQVAVFRGTNPSSVNTWGLVGVWSLGEPIGRRCMMKYAGDVLYLSVEGVFPLSVALVSSQTDPEVALTDKISHAFTAASGSYKDNFGWEMAFYPQGNQILVNVPIAENDNQQQYVMNTIKKSWWRFTAIEANCWAILNEKLYFGGEGIVALFGIALSDNTTDINTSLKQSFSYLRSRGRLKHLKAMRPNFLSNGIPAVSMGVAVDFGDDPPLNPLSFTPFTGAAWDAGVWDTANWSGDVSRYNDWQTVTNIGTAIAPHMKTTSNGLDVRYAAVDYLYEFGGVIA